MSTPAFAYDQMVGKAKVLYEGDHLEATLTNIPSTGIILVTVHGCARSGAFYYEIVDISGTSRPIFASRQVLINPGYDWAAMHTQGLFQASNTNSSVFVVRFIEDDLAGNAEVYRMGIVARVISQ